MNKVYIHKKTGKPYSLVTDNFMMKENGEWKNGLILYKAEYDNPDGEYFARTAEDFYENFIEVEPGQVEHKPKVSEVYFPFHKDDEYKIYKWRFRQPYHPVISERGKFVPAAIEVYDNVGFGGVLEDYAGKLQELKSILKDKTEQEIEEFLEFNMEPN